MTITQLIEAQQKKLRERLVLRNEAADKLAALRDAETTDEQAVHEARGALHTLDAEVDELNATLRQYREEAERDETVRRMQAEVSFEDPAPQTRSYDSVIRTGNVKEPRTYTRETHAQGVSFFADAYRFQAGAVSPAARDRIMRHAQEVEVHHEMQARATSTGSFAGLVVPQYLVEYAAPILRNGRPIATVVSKHQIPEQGMSLVIPRGTTGTSVDVQASENSNVSSTDEVWANLTIPVVTIAGQQDVSRQSLERGQGVDELIYADLVRAYAARCGTQIINGSGSSGQVLGILNTSGIGSASAFGAAASAANFNTKVAGANTSVFSGGIGLAPEVLVMHPRRWGWLTSLSDTTGRPIVVANQNVAWNAMVANNPAALDGVQAPFVGTHNSGLPILQDLNIPTNVGTNSEDVVLSIDADELHLWEDGDGMPRQLSFEQTSGGSLTTKLVVYNYIAFTAGRYPGAVAKVGGADATAGNGLIAPTF